MSQYYRALRKTNLFNPLSKEPFRLSRSKIDLFMNCPRCFYLDRKLGVAQPPGFPFALNSAVDKLLKKEFDAHRAKGTPHPLMKAYKVDAVPYVHKDMNLWRDSLRGGVSYFHHKTNFLITGGVDDVWVNPNGKLIVVDYKSTSKNGEITLDADWQIGYKRQMEIYQWLFRANGFKVSPVGYFVYCNGNTDKEAFDAKLEFEIKLIPYKGDESWVEPKLNEIKKCLMGNSFPESGKDCDFCRYKEAVLQVEGNLSLKKTFEKRDNYIEEGKLF